MRIVLMLLIALAGSAPDPNAECAKCAAEVLKCQTACADDPNNPDAKPELYAKCAARCVELAKQCKAKCPQQ